VKRVAILLLVLAGCPEDNPWVELYAITTPPPASTALVRNQETVDGKTVDVYELTLSTGVALGTQCVDSCGYSSSLEDGCALAKLAPGDPAVLAVYPIYHDGQPGQFALVAKAPGATTLHLETTCATQDYAVNIVPR
jgi:hypothetical protein